MKKRYELRVGRKSIKRTIISNLVVLSTFTAMIGLGVFLDSAAMQWAGALFWFLVIFAVAISLDKASLCTFDEARRELDEWEREVGK